MLDYIEAPLYQALQQYAHENPVLLHMPGHKGGRGFSVVELQGIGSLDYTEIPGLDDLHLPAGVIKRAQELAAQAWGAGESLFLVNGATSGIHSFFLALGEGDKVLIPRNAHRSFLGGLVFSGAFPVYLDCYLDPDLQVAVSVSPSEVQKKLGEHPDVRAAFLVSPTYYGTVNEIGEMVSILGTSGRAHENEPAANHHFAIQGRRTVPDKNPDSSIRDLPLIVDEAHGAHLVFHPDYPPSALEEGALACVHGLHKTLPVLTQAAMLHMAPGFPWRDQVRAGHDMLTTTSPSYPLMASIDLGRAIMQEQGQQLLEEARLSSDACRARINRIPGLRCRAREFINDQGVAGYDPLKILVEITDLNIEGGELARILRVKYGIQVEMARERFLLAIFSPFNSPKDWKAFADGLEDAVMGVAKRGRGVQYSRVDYPPLPPLAKTPRQAFLAASKTVMIEECTGLISAEMVAGYPPGIPCLMPGEVITAEVKEFILTLRAQGVPIHGPKDEKLQTIKVIDR